MQVDPFLSTSLQNTAQLKVYIRCYQNRSFRCHTRYTSLRAVYERKQASRLCIFDLKLKDACNRCKDLQNGGQRVCCISLKIIHVSSDQAAAQRKAHSELNGESSNDISNTGYVNNMDLACYTSVRISYRRQEIID